MVVARQCLLALHAERHAPVHAANRPSAQCYACLQGRASLFCDPLELEELQHNIPDDVPQGAWEPAYTKVGTNPSTAVLTCTHLLLHMPVLDYIRPMITDIP